MPWPTVADAETRLKQIEEHENTRSQLRHAIEVIRAQCSWRRADTHHRAGNACRAQPLRGADAALPFLFRMLDQLAG